MLFRSENEILKKKVEKLKSLIERFTCNSDKLQMILNSQRKVYDNTGLGYKSNNKQIFFKNFFFVSSFTYNTSHIIYFSYEEIGHKAFACNSRKINGKTAKKI